MPAQKCKNIHTCIFISHYLQYKTSPCKRESSTRTSRQTFLGKELLSENFLLRNESKFCIFLLNLKVTRSNNPAEVILLVKQKYIIVKETILLKIPDYFEVQNLLVVFVTKIGRLCAMNWIGPRPNITSGKELLSEEFEGHVKIKNSSFWLKSNVVRNSPAPIKITGQ